MIPPLYTRISNVAEELQKHYQYHGEYADFTDAVISLYSKGALQSAPLKFHPADGLLNTDAFREHICSQIVYADFILNIAQKSAINETNTIPAGKDIFSIAHLPFQNPIWHTHDFVEIIYVYDGACTLSFEKENWEFHNGDFVLIAPGSRHRVLSKIGSTVVGIYLRQSTFDQAFSQLLNTEDLLSLFFKHSLYGDDTENYLIFHISEPEKYQTLIQQIFDESNIDARYSNQIAVSLMNVFFGKILRDYGNTIDIYTDLKTSAFNASFPMMMRYVQSNYNTITLPKLSEVFHYSEVYISRMFKKNLNKNFSVILQDLKMSHAKDYLENTNDTIYDIAQQIGYDSVDHFSRTFKKKFQITPSEYRKRTAK